MIQGTWAGPCPTNNTRIQLPHSIAYGQWQGKGGGIRSNATRVRYEHESARRGSPCGHWVSRTDQARRPPLR
ncbi:hypothetical protein GCM10010289_42820 [Streptomyces violascens]|uniref:Uncharacterized protein n=1 Tax=Streptomyces violascens TaxID=67381 RepID=A0ABQ3QPC4_9ACTN|nr:hypothetical protein GCM10010289_42820 [Streptomyces violascens]GHI39122.1 hypothetical protein Sviol_35300 [Streptomyces violascens]